MRARGQGPGRARVSGMRPRGEGLECWQPLCASGDKVVPGRHAFQQFSLDAQQGRMAEVGSCESPGATVLTLD